MFKKISLAFLLLFTLSTSPVIIDESPERQPDTRSSSSSSWGHLTDNKKDYNTPSEDSSVDPQDPFSGYLASSDEEEKSAPDASSPSFLKELLSSEDEGSGNSLVGTKRKNDSCEQGTKKPRLTADSSPHSPQASQSETGLYETDYSAESDRESDDRESTLTTGSYGFYGKDRKCETNKNDDKLYAYDSEGSLYSVHSYDSVFTSGSYGFYCDDCVTRCEIDRYGNHYSYDSETGSLHAVYSDEYAESDDRESVLTTGIYGFYGKHGNGKCEVDRNNKLYAYDSEGSLYTVYSDEDDPCIDESGYEDPADLAAWKLEEDFNPTHSQRPRVRIKKNTQSPKKRAKALEHRKTDKALTKRENASQLGKKAEVSLPEDDGQSWIIGSGKVENTPTAAPRKKKTVYWDPESEDESTHESLADATIWDREEQYYQNFRPRLHNKIKKNTQSVRKRAKALERQKATKALTKQRNAGRQEHGAAVSLPEDDGTISYKNAYGILWTIVDGNTVDLEAYEQKRLPFKKEKTEKRLRAIRRTQKGLKRWNVRLRRSIKKNTTEIEAMSERFCLAKEAEYCEKMGIVTLGHRMSINLQDAQGKVRVIPRRWAQEPVYDSVQARLAECKGERSEFYRLKALNELLEKQVNQNYEKLQKLRDEKWAKDHALERVEEELQALAL